METNTDNRVEIQTGFADLKIDQVLKGFNRLTDKGQPLYKLATIPLTPQLRIFIANAIAKRNAVNEIRGVTKFVQYQREAKTMVDEKGMTAEIAFTKIMHQIYKNALVPGFDIETPPIAEMVLDKSRQDFQIKNKNKESEQTMTFDVKGQFQGNKSLNVNEKAFARMQQQSKFFIAGIIDCDNNSYDKATSITFYYIDNKFFEKASKKVIPTQANRTPFRTMDMDVLKKYDERLKSKGL
jgi:hypothetical protein